jgi:hypothetical protein
MNLSDLPDEILLLILSEVDDVYQFLKLSQVSRTFQRLIKSYVLVVGDSPEQSSYFRSISGGYLHMEDPIDHMKHIEKIRKYGLFILEFSGCGDHISSDPFVCCIARCKSSTRQRIIEVLMTRSGTTRCFQHRSPQWSDIETPESLEFFKLMKHVSKTMFLGDAEEALWAFKNSDLLQGNEHQVETDLIRMGHEYEFHSADSIPHFWFITNDLYPCRFVSKTVVELEGVTNTSMTSARLPPLIDFFQLSELPNLEVITGVAIESGVSLKMFENFSKLKTLELQCAYTGNDESYGEHKGDIELTNLEILSIGGNSLDLCDLTLPKLTDLVLEVHGSLEREEEKTIKFERVRMPSLLSLSMEFTSLTNAVKHVLEEISGDLKHVETLRVISSSRSFMMANELINGMKRVKKLTMKYNDIGVNDLPGDVDSPEPIEPTEPFLLELPLLEDLTLGKFDDSLLNGGQIYPNLLHLDILLRIKPVRQRYLFDEQHYPRLHFLCIEYSNSYAHLQDCNIFVELDLSDLEVVFTRQPLPVANIEYKQLPKHMSVYLLE